MTVPSVAAVVARIAAIQTRFAPQAPAGGQGFAGVLEQAQQAAGSPAPVPVALGRPQAAGGFAAQPPPAPGGDVPPGAAPWAERLPERGQPWAPAIAEAAAGAGVDPPLLAALVWAESGFDPAAVSHAGARGLAQLMPATARGLGVDADDPAANLHGGARYLREQLDRFGSLDLALAAYNAGPARVAQAGGVPAIAETRAYVPRVLGYYERLQGAS